MEVLHLVLAIFALESRRETSQLMYLIFATLVPWSSDVRQLVDGGCD